MMNYLLLAAFVLLCVWFLTDRFYYNQRMIKRYLEDAEKLENLIIEYKAKADQSVTKIVDKEWDLMLLESARDDSRILIKDYQHDLDANMLNKEFQKAKSEFIKAFRNHQPLRDKIARIINLLQLDNIAYEEGSRKSQKHLN